MCAHSLSIIFGVVYSVRVVIKNVEFPKHFDKFLPGTVDGSPYPFSEMIFTAQVYSDGMPSHPNQIYSRTPPIWKERLSLRCNEWSNETLIFPLSYKDLTFNSRIVFRLWATCNVCVAVSAMAFFREDGLLRDGIQRLIMMPCVGKLDINTHPSQIDADALLVDGTDHRSSEFASVEEIAVTRIEKIRECYSREDIPKVEWLDHITLKELQNIQDGSINGQSSHFIMQAEFPSFPHPVVFEQERYLVSLAKQPPRLVVVEPVVQMFSTMDHELEEDNPVESKYRQLKRDQMRGQLDETLKPNKVALSLSLSRSLRVVRILFFLPSSGGLLWPTRRPSLFILLSHLVLSLSLLW